ncbi:MAG: Type IV pilus assembly protein PilM [Parcubacteria bacterium C7867-004]|nr:MAG: Type IV pilus assembly protein PilM [Parcubacteria bacterium C7867-004]
MSFLTRIFGKTKKGGASVIGIDIGSSSLKVVQLRREGGTAVLETYGELALGPYAGAEAGQATNLSAAVITETLNDLLREANVTTKDAGISIPFSRSLLTLIELPKRENPEEQKTVIELEARKYIPVPVSEVQLDWFIIPEFPAEGAEPSGEAELASVKVQVLLVAVHNDELALLESVVQGAQLAASFYEIEIFSTIRAVVDEPVKPVMVLDIGASATKVYVVEHGVVAFSHNIPQGGQDVTRTIATANSLTVKKAEELKKEHGFADGKEAYDRSTIELVFSHIFEEARRVSTQYQMLHGKTVSALVLTGGGGVTKELEQYAKTFFSVNVEIANPFSKVQAPAFMRPVLEAIGPEFAVAVGLALRKLEEIA